MVIHQLVCCICAEDAFGKFGFNLTPTLFTLFVWAASSKLAHKLNLQKNNRYNRSYAPLRPRIGGII